MFQSIIDHLHHDNNFSGMKDNDKMEFMAFFEDIAFLMNSGLIKKEVAFYMFGYDVITAYNNDIFWSEDFRKDKLWSLLTDFVNQMTQTQKTFKYNRKQMRL
jgi:hypothetical protein